MSAQTTSALVTGANGFLGRQVVAALCNLGVRVRAMARNRSTLGDLPNGATASEASLQNEASLRRACESVDIVFHIAAAMGGSGSALVYNNVVGTRNLLAAIKDGGVSCFVNVSSLGVYDADYVRRNSVVTETAPLEAKPERRDGYCYSKVMQERVAQDMLGGSKVDLVTIRPGVIYGPTRPGIGTRIGLKYGSVLLKMGKRKSLPYTHVSNCADALSRIGLFAKRNEVYNVVDSEVPTARELIRSFRTNEGKLLVLPIPQILVGPLSRASLWYHNWSRGQLPAVMTPIDAMTLWNGVEYPNDKLRSAIDWQQPVTVAAAIQGMASRS